MSKRPERDASRRDRRPPDRKHDHRRGAEAWKDPTGEDGPTLLFGVHAVEAALRNPRRRLLQLFVSENAENRLKDALAARRHDTGLKLSSVTPRDLDRRLGADTVHQGILLECEPLPDVSLEELADAPLPHGPLVVLDQVTDPHNVGAILRSAAVFGAQGLVMTRRHSPPLGGVLAKSASGALELVPVALVPNLARALDELQRLAYHRVGLDGDGDALIEDETFAGKVAIVLGAEGRGLRQLTRENCDTLARISGSGPLASLNVSNAVAVTLHLASMRRRQAGG